MTAGARKEVVADGGRWGLTGCLACLVALALSSLPCTVWADQAPTSASSGLPPVLRGADFTPQLDAGVPLDLTFRDETGRAVRLRDYFGRKPVILAPVYFSCPMLCNQVLNGLASSLKVLSFDVGKEITIVAASFNPADTPALAAAKKQDFLGRYHRAGAAEGVHFLTAEPAAIQALMRAVGFRYAFDPATNLYAHASGILILTPGGKISRYFFGIEYAPRDVRLGLVEASANKIGTPADRVLLFCYQYDPATGKYGALVLRLVRLGGIATVLFLCVLVFIFVRRDARPDRWKSSGAS